MSRQRFTNGLISNAIRQRLLENQSLTLDAAVDQARAMETAQKQSETYTSNLYQVNAATEKLPPRQTSEIEAIEENDSNFIIKPQLAASVSKCFFCGRNRHPRYSCPARDTFCNNCGKKGHFAKVCRAVQVKKKQPYANALIATIHKNIPENLAKAVIPIKVNDNQTDALVDTGSTNSFINVEFARSQGVRLYPCRSQISMASTSLSSTVSGQCSVTLDIQGEKHTNISLLALPVPLR